MTTELILQPTKASGPLVPPRFSQVLANLSSAALVPGPAATASPRGVIHGQELRLALVLPLANASCAAFLLEFGGQGQRVKGGAHGPSAALLSWAFHALASSLKCTLFDTNLGHDIDVDPEEHRDAAVAYLAEYEADVMASRKPQTDEQDAAAFLAWLVREEHVALADAESQAVGLLSAELPMENGPALYEMLLASDTVADVFISERELGWLLARFHARRISKP